MTAREINTMIRDAATRGRNVYASLADSAKREFERLIGKFA